ncbi:MAG: hypothetical protein HYT39_00560 [Candidatus Sungbacteria bacterium]|nr:hypothetical protein [Candidatus Sungbacteria bacterium]
MEKRPNIFGLIMSAIILEAKSQKQDIKITRRTVGRSLILNSKFLILNKGFTPTPGSHGRKAAVWGFTLLETIVALAVILGAIVGPYTLATRGIVNTATAKNKLAALNIAEDGIELVRKIREDNILAGRRWDTDIPTGEWQIDLVSGALTSDPLDQPLTYYPSTGVYARPNNESVLGGGSSVSPFTRVVRIDKPPTVQTPGINDFDGNGVPTQLRIRSTVSWDERIIVKRVVLEEIIYNWQ